MLNKEKLNVVASSHANYTKPLTEKKKLTVLLINPMVKNNYGFSTPPIGLSYLSAAVKDAGHNIYVYDMQQNNRDEQGLLCFLKENKILPI